ncbi:uncharacterized protein LOC126907316 [Daktulosphaira vitifoliae]|uniref:uncharacterized protein LOC126907316 n=1 Tax=Daktulosphaira vitifoliae TaxID=58002 RepID=UPI0021A9D356|nr:uncharacterized protein LOC126907316 [Daktulosphaira vitifoliae]XP_050544460.1 uncharacterized protein LOC126907316 [Daktulosphaira vitifoliae]XP_050544461.1 uncharacterized protein LOC126907316 [Daktulosphaira vitifoliae]
MKNKNCYSVIINSIMLVSDIKIIILRLFIIFLKYTNFIVANDLIDLHCNFSKYMLNYFKYSEKYLYNFENTISELELRNYGLAIKSHDDIIMIMLDALRELDESYRASDLIAVNLYLNNVSGSLNMIAKGKNGEFGKSESTQCLLEGYKIIHQSIVRRLEYIINNECTDVSFENDFISYTYFNVKIICNSINLLRVLEQLKNKVFIVMNEYILWYEAKDEEILNSYNNIVKHLSLSFYRQSYNNFNPKNILFYDLMENRSNFCELELSSGSQTKQTAICDENYRLKDILDMLRYASVNKKASNNYRIKLFDIFRYIKFDFNPKNVQVYIEMVNAATVRPVIFLVRYYMHLINSFISNQYLYDLKFKFEIKIKIIELGENILEKFKSFMDLNLFTKLLKLWLDEFYNRIYYIISIYKERNDLFFHKEIEIFLKTYFAFLKKNFLKSQLKKLHKYKITKDNICEIYDSLEHRINEIALYNEKLKKYQDCFEIVNRYLPIKHRDTRSVVKFKYNIPFEQLGYYEDIYHSLYYHVDDTKDNKKYYNETSIEENNDTKEPCDNNKNVTIQNEAQHIPKYLIDYILFV